MGTILGRKRYLMRNLFLGILLLIGLNARSQSYSELGVYGGTAFYMGDVNTNSLFYNSKLAIGGVFRHNFSDRYALRGNLIFSNIEASDTDFNNQLQQNRKHAFRTKIVDLSLQMEFNFQPFWVPQKNKTKKVSPYITAGIGYLAWSETNGGITIPLGLGAKFILSDKVTLTTEWSFRKTFTDTLDELSDPYNLGQNSLLHNNDWVSFCGFIISLRVFSNDNECNSYGNKKQ